MTKFTPAEQRGENDCPKIPGDRPDNVYYRYIHMYLFKYVPEYISKELCIYLMERREGEGRD